MIDNEQNSHNYAIRDWRERCDLSFYIDCNVKYMSKKQMMQECMWTMYTGSTNNMYIHKLYVKNKGSLSKVTIYI